jgi:hypothetical protein
VSPSTSTKTGNEGWLQVVDERVGDSFELGWFGGITAVAVVELSAGNCSIAVGYFPHSVGVRSSGFSFHVAEVCNSFQ